MKPPFIRLHKYNSQHQLVYCLTQLISHILLPSSQHHADEDITLMSQPDVSGMSMHLNTFNKLYFTSVIPAKPLHKSNIVSF